MEKTICLDILLAVIASALTCIVNWLTIVAEIEKDRKNRTNESRLPLYIECYEFLERNIADSNIVFQREYIDGIIKLKAKMKLIASNKVLQSFKAYYKWAVDIYKGYLDYCIKNDPTNKVHIEIASDGTEFEMPDFNEYDLEKYEFLQERYIIDRAVRTITVQSKIQEVLNSMRSDLGNDAFKDS